MPKTPANDVSSDRVGTSTRTWVRPGLNDTQFASGWAVKPVGMSTPTTKYRDIDPVARRDWRLAHNEPVVWPLYVLVVGGVLLLVPGIVTYLRERQ